jgi:hypothetical protein
MRTTVQRAARFLVQAVKLMRAKDHDYGDAWKEMSIESHLDRIMAKVTRIRRIRANGFAAVSEGVRSEVLDIINYAVFIALTLEDQDGQAQQGDSGSEAGSGGWKTEYLDGAVVGGTGTGATQAESAGTPTDLSGYGHTTTQAYPLGTVTEAG